eukprot:SAG31_NODE_4943_length_2845_cov_1.656227_1_plen_947_part_11
MPRWRYADSTVLKLKRLFQIIDEDGSGEIDKDECEFFLKETCQIEEKDQLEKLWERLQEKDKNGDKKLDQDEFVDGFIASLGWGQAGLFAQDALGVLAGSASEHSPQEVVIVKTGKLLGRTLEDVCPEHDQPNTLVAAVRACSVLLQAAGVNGNDKNYWRLARDSLVAVMLILNRLSSTAELDANGTHSSCCENYSPGQTPEQSSRERIIKQLIASERDELLGSTSASVIQNLNVLIPIVSNMLHHLHTVIHDGRRATDFPDVQVDIRRACQTKKVIERSSTEARSSPEASYDVVPCLRSTNQLDPGVLVITDSEILFAPSAGFEARQKTVSVQTHATAIHASGPFGISVTLDSDGVKGGTVLELTVFSNRDRCLQRLKSFRAGAILREKVWSLCLECFAALAFQVPDSQLVGQCVEKYQMVQVLCDRLASLQRDAVEGVGTDGHTNENSEDLPSDHIHQSQLGRSDSDSHLGCRLLDVLMVLYNIGAQHRWLIDTLVSNNCIPIVTRFKFDDIQLAQIHRRDGRHTSAHALWCKVVQFVATATRIICRHDTARHNRRCLQQVLDFIMTHQLRLGFQWSATECIRTMKDRSGADHLIWQPSLDSAHSPVSSIPACGMAKLAGLRWADTPGQLVEPLPARDLSLMWLQEVEAVSTLISVLGPLSSTWRMLDAENERLFHSILKRLMGTAMTCLAILQTDALPKERAELGRQSTAKKWSESPEIDKTPAAPSQKSSEKPPAAPKTADESKGLFSLKPKPRSHSKRSYSKRSQSSGSSKKIAAAAIADVDTSDDVGGGAVRWIHIFHRKHRTDGVHDASFVAKIHKHLSAILHRCMIFLRSSGPGPIGTLTIGAGAVMHPLSDRPLFDISMTSSGGQPPELQFLSKLLRRLPERRLQLLLREHPSASIPCGNCSASDGTTECKEYGRIDWLNRSLAIHPATMHADSLYRS